MASAQSEIQALIDRRSEAIRSRDLDRLMAVYAPDVVYFDLVPPLRYEGSPALRGRFREWFDGWQSGIRQDVRDLVVLTSGDIAAAHMLIRSGGTRKNGQEVGFWVRTSDFCRRSNGAWLITHEHVSLPVDLKTGSAAMDLAP